MKKIIILSASIIGLSCSKKIITDDIAAFSTKSLTAKINDKIWISKTAARDASSAASSYSYYASASADGQILSLMAYGTAANNANKPADKLGIVINSFSGAGKYIINSTTGARAVFASVNADAVPVDIYYSNIENFINVETNTGNKISGTFSFTAVSASGIVKVTDGIFTDVAY